MFKNMSGQKVVVFAFDSTTNAPKTGDAANITAYISKDFGAVTVLTDTSATEMDATNAKGYYLFDIALAETNADVVVVTGKSSTSNIVVVGAPATIFTLPASMRAIYNGLVTSAPTTTGFVDSAQAAAANTLRGRVIIFYGGASIPYQAAVITANTGSGAYTFAAIPNAPAVSDQYVIV